MKTYRIYLVLLLFVCLVGIHPAWAEDDAMMTVSSAYKTMKGLCRIVSGLCLAIGAVKCYNKVQSGDPSSSYQGILAWFSGFLIALVIPSIVDGLFR